MPVLSYSLSDIEHKSSLLQHILHERIRKVYRTVFISGFVSPVQSLPPLGLHHLAVVFVAIAKNITEEKRKVNCKMLI